jgi:hypothetical protein
MNSPEKKRLLPFLAVFLILLNLQGAFALSEGQASLFVEAPAAHFYLAALPEPFFFVPLFSLAAVETDTPIPESLRNNQYYRESLRLTNLARLSYGEGDYDTSTDYSEEAVRYARLSDEYVALRLKMKETNDAITAAKTRLDWTVSSGASKRYPREYGEATNYYNTSLSLRTAEDWDGAIDAAHRVIDILAYVQGGEEPKVAETPPPPRVVEASKVVEKPAEGPVSLPAQYTVRTWANERDCFWNIAGRPWVYGDPRQWQRLYNANRAKLPDPNNPNLIEPGMVLDIPSINGEVRQGLWDAGKTYPSLR